MFLICVFGAIFLISLHIVLKDEKKQKEERYERKASGGWAAKPQNPSHRMKYSFVEYRTSRIGTPREPTEREKFEYGMTHMGYFPPYCNRKHEHCRSCGLCNGDGTRDCRGYSVVNGLGFFPPSECLNCSYRLKHGGGDPFWDCGHPQAKHVMRDAEMGLGICRPMFGPGVACPFKSCTPGRFSEDWAKARKDFSEWTNLVSKYIEDVKEIKDGKIVWKETQNNPAVRIDPVVLRRFEAQHAAALNGTRKKE